MSALSVLFDKKLDQRSPVQRDVYRRVSYDSDGNELITFESVDYPTFQKSLGSADMWSINSLLKAGINPNFGIKTSFSTRLEAENFLSGISSAIDTLFPVESPAVSGEDKQS